MLVLTRKEGDTVHIDDNIILRVLRIEEDQVKVGIEAPQDVKILRGEIIGRDAGGPKRSVYRR